MLTIITTTVYFRKEITCKIPAMLIDCRLFRYHDAGLSTREKASYLYAALGLYSLPGFSMTSDPRLDLEEFRSLLLLGPYYSPSEGEIKLHEASSIPYGFHGGFDDR